jgi:biotin carboxyl carrier protein
MERRFQIAGEELALAATAEAGGWRVRLPDGTERHIAVRRLGESCVELTTKDGDITRTLQIPVARTERGIEVAWNGDVFVFSPAEERRARPVQRASGTMAAPMPGIVVDVLVSAGDTVEPYQPLAVVEAMKVMATVEAPFAGTVTTVNVQKGARVRQGEVLVEITPDTGP